MTAFDLIAQWFQKPQQGVASNLRYITMAQLELLRKLIDQDPEGGALRSGLGRSFVWAPMGRDKYVVTEDASGGRRHTIARLSDVVPAESGRLF